MNGRHSVSAWLDREHVGVVAGTLGSGLFLIATFLPWISGQLVQPVYVVGTFTAWEILVGLIPVALPLAGVALGGGLLAAHRSTGVKESHGRPLLVAAFAAVGIGIVVFGVMAGLAGALESPLEVARPEVVVAGPIGAVSGGLLLTVEATLMASPFRS